MELAEKLEQAFAAYLQSLATWPDSLKDADGALQIFPGENDAPKDQQCVVCVAENGDIEDPPMSGNRHIPFRIEVRTPVADPSPIADHEAVTAALETAILDSTLSDLVNAAAYAKAIASPGDFADLDNFCLYPVISRTPIREQDEELWVSGHSLGCYCMGIKG